MPWEVTKAVGEPAGEERALRRVPGEGRGVRETSWLDSTGQSGRWKSLWTGGRGGQVTRSASLPCVTQPVSLSLWILSPRAPLPVALGVLSHWHSVQMRARLSGTKSGCGFPKRERATHTHPVSLRENTCVFTSKPQVVSSPGVWRFPQGKSSRTLGSLSQPATPQEDLLHVFSWG